MKQRIYKSMNQQINQSMMNQINEPIIKSINESIGQEKYKEAHGRSWPVSTRFNE